jgi:hypothetical protein
VNELPKRSKKTPARECNINLNKSPNVVHTSKKRDNDPVIEKRTKKVIIC